MMALTLVQAAFHRFTRIASHISSPGTCDRSIFDSVLHLSLACRIMNQVHLLLVNTE